MNELSFTARKGIAFATECCEMSIRASPVGGTPCHTGFKTKPAAFPSNHRKLIKKTLIQHHVQQD